MEFTLKPDGSLGPVEGESPEKAPDGPADGAPAPALDADGLIVGVAADAGPGAADLIKESNTANFMADVIEASAEVPVIVDFWAPWCGPCKQLGPALEKQVRDAAGMVKLVKINIDENQELAAQMRIQSIPAVYAFKNGQPVDGFMGALPEGQIKAFISRLTGGAKAPIDAALEQATETLAAGDTMTAGAIFAKVLGQDPENAGALAGMIRVALAEGDQGRARGMADSLSPELAKAPEIAAAVTALELTEQGRESGDVEELRGKVAADGNDHQARFDLATALYGEGRNEAALDELLELFRRDRGWNDDAARVQMVKIFDALGPTHPVTVDGRRRLSSLMFS